MKTYSIGRDLNCDIVINDNTDVISRRHALLNVAPSGKMTIVDQSSNGTYVNGIRISPNVPVPVTRKDTVSLAHVARLDWNRVPRPNAWVKWVIVAVVALAAIIGGISIYNHLPGKVGSGDPTAVATDSIKDKAKADSIKDQQKKDSAEKVKKAAKGKSKSKQQNAGKDSSESDGKTQDNASKPKNSKEKQTPSDKDRDKNKDKNKAGRHTMG